MTGWSVYPGTHASLARGHGMVPQAGRRPLRCRAPLASRIGHTPPHARAPDRPGRPIRLIRDDRR